MFSFENGEREGASVYQKALGAHFDDLDPQLRSYFGSVPSGFEGIGSGRYDEAGLRIPALRPVFTLLGRRGIAFAEFGTGIPFTVRNVADASGTLLGQRTFVFPGAVRTMVDGMRFEGGRLIDRIGTRGEIEVELVPQVSRGALRLTSRTLALRLCGIRIPLPPIVRVELQERACAGGEQSVTVRLSAPLLGVVYGYSGRFRYALQPTPAA